MKKLILAIAAAFGASMLGQAPGTGAYQHATFDNLGFDQVNVGNLNIRFNIPLIQKAGRGMPFNYSFQYEGLIWQPYTDASSGLTTWVPDPDWGFKGSLNGNGVIGSLSYTSTATACGTGVAAELINYAYHDPFGAVHAFNYSYRGPCPNGTPAASSGDGSTTDGSGYRLINGIQVQTSNGLVINAQTVVNGSSQSNPMLATDANGNEISFNGSGTFTDTTGTQELAISGSNPVQFSYPVTEQANGSTTATASLYYTSYTIRTAFQCSNIIDYGSETFALVDHLTLADGETYYFTYEGTPGADDGAVTGRLASVKLPSGGTIRYQYRGGCGPGSGTGIIPDGSAGPLSRTTSDGTRNYDRTNFSSNGNSGTLTDEVGNVTFYDFTVDPTTGNYYETQRQVFQGANNGHPLQETVTCYNGNSTPCNRASFSTPITEADVTQQYNGIDPVTTKSLYDSSGSDLTQSSVYSGQNLWRKTANQYTTPNLVTELTSTTVYDGNNNVVSYTGYGYDESTPNSTSNLPQHSTPSANPGNLTSVHVSIDGSTSNTLTTVYNYFDTGMVQATAAPGNLNGANSCGSGTITCYGYDSTGTFLTSTILPTPSSGVALSTSASYDAASGALLSSTGVNQNQTSSITQYDSLLRPTAAQTPEGGKITAAYSPTQLSAGREINSSLSSDTETFLDGYGRTTRVAVASSSGWYLTDYCYTNGVLQFKTPAYLSSSDSGALNCSTSAATQYTYDGLHRLTQIATPDGNTITKTYTGRAVETANANGTTKVQQYDALGRLTGICEIGSATDAAGNNPSACQGFDISGTGFTTTYSYNNNSAQHWNVMVVAQGAQSRFYASDLAGRSVATKEPELAPIDSFSSTTRYSYAYNSIGLQVVRTRPQANLTENESSASPTTTTTTQYDVLGRVVQVSYSDGTPTKNIYYDSPFQSGQGSVKGQISGLDTVTGSGALVNASNYFYDIMGRVTEIDDCLPDWCNVTGDAYQWYAYDFASDVVTQHWATDQGGNGPTTVNYTYNAAGQMLTINTDLNNATSAPLVYSATASSMQPGGPQFVTYGNNTTAWTAYDVMNRFGGRWTCGLPGGYNCPNSTYYYGVAQQQIGQQVKWQVDTVLHRWTQFSYDQFGNLAGSSPMPNSGYQALNFSAAYDRYGNRWSETVSNTPSGAGPAQNLVFNTANNQALYITYDQAGNLINDGQHTYQYDAENNLISIDNGSTASYTYNALGQRDKVVTSAGTDRFGFDLQGRRLTTWQDGYAYVKAHQFYSDQGPVAFFTNANNIIQFEYQDPIGTERLRTDNSGNVQANFASLPFGEPNNTVGPDINPAHFTGLDQDGNFSASSLGLHHAMAREYNSTLGRWMSPDPYAGSYRFGNPQSLNRYSYVLNNPLAFVDTLGLDLSCNGRMGPHADEDGDGDCDGGSTGEPDGGGSNIGSTDTGTDGSPACPVDACVTADPDPDPDPISNPISDPINPVSTCGDTNSRNGVHRAFCSDPGSNPTNTNTPNNTSTNNNMPDENNQCSVLNSQCKPLPTCLQVGFKNVGTALFDTLDPRISMSTFLSVSTAGAIAKGRFVTGRTAFVGFSFGFIYNLIHTDVNELANPTPCYR